MPVADHVDGEHSEESVHRHSNGLTHNGQDSAPLSEDEDGDRKPVIVGTRAHSMENGTYKANLDLGEKNGAGGADALTNGNGLVSGDPPDGGLRAWSIMVGSFIINGVLFSVINTYSLIYLELQRRLTESGEKEVSSKAALVGSLTIGTTFFLSPVAGILTDKIGIQLTTFIGGALAAAGMFLSSLLADRVEYLCLTYGVMYGMGASLAYTPSLVILGHYFKRHLGFVNGVVTTGSSVFTILLPYALEYFLSEFGLEGTLKSLAVLTAVVMACGILFKPIPLHSPEEEEALRRKKKFRTMLKQVVNVSIWKRKKYVVWAGAIPIALFGYFVPYVHIGKFVETNFVGADKKLPVMCIGVTSGIGRLVFGYIADLPKVNRILLQQISFVSIGILTMLLSCTKSYPLLLFIALCMGLFDGCFISLLGPIAFDICGQKDAAQAIGFLLGMCSIPLTAGPPIAGLIYDHTASYQLPFLLAGVPPILGALAMMLVYRVKDEPIEQEDDDDRGGVEETLTDPKRQNGISCLYLSGELPVPLLDSTSPKKNKVAPEPSRHILREPSDECSPLLRKYRGSPQTESTTLQQRLKSSSSELLLIL